MRHKFLVLPVKKLLKSVHIYGSYHKIKTGVPFFGTLGILMTNRKLHMRFRLALRSMTLDDLELL